MPIEIKWRDAHPETGEKVWIRAERFGHTWRFTFREHRRGIWTASESIPNRVMWEHVLDALERRYQRREGVTDNDLKQVRAILGSLPPLERDIEESEE